MSTQKPEQNENYHQNLKPLDLAARLKFLMAQNQSNSLNQSKNQIFDGNFQLINQPTNSQNIQNNSSQFQTPNQFQAQFVLQQQNYNQNRESLNQSYFPNQTQNQNFQENYEQNNSQQNFNSNPNTFVPNQNQNNFPNQSFSSIAPLPPLPTKGEIITQLNPKITEDLDQGFATPNLGIPNRQEISNNQEKPDLEPKIQIINAISQTPTPNSAEQISEGKKLLVHKIEVVNIIKRSDLTKVNAAKAIQDVLNKSREAETMSTAN